MATNSNKVLIICIFINLAAAFATMMSESPTSISTSMGTFVGSSGQGGGISSTFQQTAAQAAQCANATNESIAAGQSCYKPSTGFVTTILSYWDAAANIGKMFVSILAIFGLAVIPLPLFVKAATIMLDPSQFMILRALAMGIIMILGFSSYMVLASIITAIRGRLGNQ